MLETALTRRFGLSVPLVSAPMAGASGGVAGPRGLAAVLAAGADGAWVGTAFLACPESELDR